MTCLSQSGNELERGVKVELLINDVPVEGRTLRHQHSSTVIGATSLSASAKIALKKGDKITVRVTPYSTVANGQAATYCAKADGTSLTIERLRIH